MKQLALLVAAFVIAIAIPVFATQSELAKDGAGVKMQAFAPDARKATSLGVASQTIDMTNDIAWSVYVPSGCKFRVMSTGTKAGPTRTVPSATWLIRNIKSRSAFVNFSGCTSGELQRH